MNGCILHVGMPKTGTSSIQESLFFGLRDPGFRYYSAGEVNGSRMLWASASSTPPPFSHWKKQPVARAHLERKHRSYRRGLTRVIDESIRKGKTLILSGEDCWSWDEEQMRGMRALLESKRLVTRVIIYLRPWRSYLESNFQERIKHASLRFTANKIIPMDELMEPGNLDYPALIERFESVFGADQVIARKFDPDLFPAGCVVQDFCRQFGIRMDPESIRRANDALGINAVRMLHAYGRYGADERRYGLLAIWQHYQMILALKECPDRPFRFHSRLANPILEPFSRLIPQIEARIGASFREDGQTHDHADCIRNMEDLSVFEENSVRWLAARTRTAMPGDLRGEKAAMHVAMMVHRLRHQLPPLKEIASSLQRFSGRSWTGWLHQH